MNSQEASPFSFVDHSFAVVDASDGAVCCTRFGNLAVFNTRSVADHYAALSCAAGRAVKVVPVSVQPVVEH